METRCRVDEETRDYLEDEARREEMNRFEQVGKKHKTAQRTKKETLAHYKGEIVRLQQQHLGALIDCFLLRPELSLDAVVRQVSLELDNSISEVVIQKFKDAVKRCG